MGEPVVVTFVHSDAMARRRLPQSRAGTLEPWQGSVKSMHSLSRSVTARGALV